MTSVSVVVVGLFGPSGRICTIVSYLLWMIIEAAFEWRFDLEDILNPVCGFEITICPYTNYELDRELRSVDCNRKKANECAILKSVCLCNVTQAQLKISLSDA